MKVLVLMKNDGIGGAVVSRERYPGFNYSDCSGVSFQFRPEIMRDLELPRHGLQILPCEGSAVRTETGCCLGMFRDHDANRREFARHSRRDAEACDHYPRAIQRDCRFSRPMLLRTPPDPSWFRPRDILELLDLGRPIGALFETQRAEMVRFRTMSISDFLDEYFENPGIKAWLAVSAIIGTAFGPLSPDSVYRLLHHYMGDVDGNLGARGFVRGVMRSKTKALTASLRAAKGDVGTEAQVTEITVKNGRTTGVVLAKGEEIKAKRVISNMDAKRSFLKTVKESDLPPEFMASVKKFKTRSSSAKLNIALDAAPTFTALPEGAPNIKGDLHVTDAIARIERGHDDRKSGHLSRDPFQDVMIPTMIDPTIVPPATHFMSCFVQYAPPKIAGRDGTDADHNAQCDTCLNQIESYASGFKNNELHVEVRTPPELEVPPVTLTERPFFKSDRRRATPRDRF